MGHSPPRMVAHYSADATVERGAVAKYLEPLRQATNVQGLRRQTRTDGLLRYAVGRAPAVRVREPVAPALARNGTAVEVGAMRAGDPLRLARNAPGYAPAVLAKDNAAAQRQSRGGFGRRGKGI